MKKFWANVRRGIIGPGGLPMDERVECYRADDVDAEIAKRKRDFAERIVWWHSQLQDVLAEVRALDRVVADDLEAVMNQMWEAKDEVRK